MRNALASAVLLAAWACSSPCWGADVKAGPAPQTAALQKRIAALERENAALQQAPANGRRGNADGGNGGDGNGGDKWIAGAIGAGVAAAATRAVDERRIKRLTEEKDALSKSLEEAQATARRQGEDLQTTQNRLKEVEAELQSMKRRLDEALAQVGTLQASAHDLEKRLDAANAGADSQKQTSQALKASLDEKQGAVQRLQTIIDNAGPPLWPWGGLAAAAALLLGGAAARWMWPKPVHQPLAVNVELGDWKAQATPQGSTPASRFSIRAELIPLRSSIRPSGESLLREVRSVPQGALP